MPARPGRWRLPTKPSTRDGASHDIFAPGYPPCQWFPRLASALDPRSAPRLARLLLGAVLARGRRTVTAWIRAVGLSREYKPLLHDRRRGRQAGRQRLGPVAQRCGQAAGRRPGAAHPGAGRHADAAVRAPRPGGRHPSQPDPRPGRLAARLRPHLGRAGAAGCPSRLGGDRAAAFGPDVRPGHRPAGHRPQASAQFRTKLELGVELLRWARLG
jgi:hypothetical protein